MATSQRPLVARLKSIFGHQNKTDPERKSKCKIKVPSTAVSSEQPKLDGMGRTETTCGDRHPSIAIIGAGIGGLALAIALARKNVPCNIYDAGDTYSTVGAGIGLGSNSLAALDLIDPRPRSLYDLAKTGNDSESLRHCVFDALYAEPGFGQRRDPPHIRGPVGAPYFERSSAHRKDLLTIMESFIPFGTVHFSKRLVEVKDHGDKTEAVFHDGEGILVDAVIGCDGIYGATRKIVLSGINESIAPEYCNMYLYRGIIPMGDAKAVLGKHGGDSKRFLGKGRGVVVYPISRGCDANLMFYVCDNNAWAHGHGTIRCAREEMRQDFDGFDDRLLTLLESLETTRWPVFHHRSTPTYFKGRVCMLGDVAHAASPHQAAGAGQSLEDAVVLAHVFALVQQPMHLEAAFQAYDEIRRPRATEVVESSYVAGSMYCFEGPEGDDINKIVTRANEMFHSIWEHDLEADTRMAEKKFEQLICPK